MNWLGGTVILILLLTHAGSAAAQVQSDQWSAPHRLSSADGAYVDHTNRLVADRYGSVHAVWIENGFADGRAIIQYARFDGKNWTVPVDIYTTNDTVDRLSLAIDHRNLLHLVWTEGGSFLQRPIYYSTAPADDASSAKQWTNPLRIDISAHLINLQVDTNGTLHILFSQFWEPNAGVHYIRSTDQGLSWSEPLWFDPDILPEHAPSKLRFALDDAGGLHAVWVYQTRDATDGDWVRYVHSLDGGQSWSSPFTIDKLEDSGRNLSQAGPLLAVDGQAVHIVWAAAPAGRALRHYRFSNDSGRSWSEPERIFGQLNGQADDDLVIDGAGRPHFLGQIRYPQGIYHAYLDRDGWTDPSLIYLIIQSAGDPIGDRIHAHRLRAAVRAANQLLVTFYDRAEGHPSVLYSMHSTPDDVALAPIESAPIATERPSSNMKPTPLTPAPAVPTSRSIHVTADSAQVTTDTENPDASIWLGLVPALLLTGLVVFVRVVRTRRMQR